MSAKLKVVLVGAGGWGRQHARIFADRQDIDFRAIAGRTPERTKERAEEFGVRHYLDVDAMLDAEQPDLVSICLPNQGHFDTTLAVIRRGYPLFVEKPLVFDLEEADTLLAEAEKRNLFFAINFNHRYARPVEMARQAIEGGRLGELVFASWRFGGEGGDCPNHDNLIETQCHGFDMLEHLCGPIASVMAEMSGPGQRKHSTMAAALRFANGAVGSLVGSYDSSYAYQRTHQLEVNGAGGRLVVDDTVKRFTFQATGNETAEVWEAGYFNDADRQFHLTFDKHFDAVVRALRAGEAPPIHARCGRRALELAMACVESFKTGERVSIGGPGEDDAS